MNAGKTLFAQIMEFVPWKTFGRIIERHRGDAGVRTLGCAEVFRIMAFAQLTWRESLRDIETCMAANQDKLFHMGLKSPPARSTLADALNLRDWRIWKTCGRIIERHRGDAGVRTLGCAEVFRIMAFAQLTWRESLREGH